MHEDQVDDLQGREDREGNKNMNDNNKVTSFPGISKEDRIAQGHRDIAHCGFCDSYDSWAVVAMHNKEGSFITEIQCTSCGETILDVANGYIKA